MSDPIPHITPCARCESLLKNKNPIVPFKKIRLGSAGDLVQSAENGCRLCAMVVSQLKVLVADDDCWEGDALNRLRLTVLFAIQPSHGMTAALHSFIIVPVSVESIYSSARNSPRDLQSC